MNIDNKHLIEYLTKQTFKYIPVAVSEIIVVVCSPTITLYRFSICSEGYGELKSDEHYGRERLCNFETISGKVWSMSKLETSHKDGGLNTSLVQHSSL